MQQSVRTAMPEAYTEAIDIPGTELRVSRVALGTWAMGGWMWGGTDERAAVATIRAALEQGINLIDTAPVYGFGVSEEIVGRALGVAGVRARAVVATKVGLEWHDGKVYRNASQPRIIQEVDDSLRRLRTDSMGRGRSAPSVSAISQTRRWSAFAAWPLCTWCNHRTTCSSGPSKHRFFPTAARTTSQRWAMARCVVGC
jgi:hypothetical protein